MNAREAVLDRVRSALADVTEGEKVRFPRRVDGVRRQLDDRVGLFAERVADYRAHVVRCSADEVAAAVERLLPAGASVVVPPRLPDAFLPSSVELIRDNPAEPLSAAALDGVHAVVTTSALGIAETGTVVLDHGSGQGRRALTLIPDLHICLVDVEDIVDDVPTAVARLGNARVQTWISGPSATSDIELQRVEGVHGPRTLHVLIVEGAVTDTPAEVPR
jgi:L-lactate dehydrogenase complex protein LldG